MHLLPDPCSAPRERRRSLIRPVQVLAAALVAVSALGACTSVASLVTPYKIDIQQGNVVTREQAQALQPGMSRVEVRDILGSPLLTSVFHADRWDYVFTFRRQGADLQQRKLTVFFQNEVLARIESDELPTEAEFVASLDVRRKAEKPPVLQATEAQLEAFQERNAVTRTPAPEPVPVPGRSYPPLESGASQ